jgi:hypothetical protein
VAVARTPTGGNLCCNFNAFTPTHLRPHSNALLGQTRLQYIFSSSGTWHRVATADPVKILSRTPYTTISELLSPPALCIQTITFGSHVRTIALATYSGATWRPSAILSSSNRSTRRPACQHRLVARIAATQIHRQVVVSVAIGLGIAFSHSSASYATKGTNVAVLAE